MTYRAAPVTQRDGWSLQNSNCLMATAAVGLDYHTFGSKTSTGKKMREYSGDTSGGTNTDEIERAWHTGYDEDPVTRDGQPWDKVIDDLHGGRLVMLQVWAATVGPSGMCLSGSGAYGHGISVAPERNGSKWLVADPWCKPPKWGWVEEGKLKAGAEEWVQHSASGASGAYGREWPDPRTIPLGLLRAAARRLMDQYTPDHPSPHLHPPAGVAGPSGVLFASTAAHPEADDMAINTNGSRMTSVRRVRLTAEAGFYADAALNQKYGTLSEGRECVLLGPALGFNSFAILVNTSKPYDDHEDRETVVYVTKDKCSDPYQVDVPPPDYAERDKQWRAWLDGDADAPDR